MTDFKCDFFASKTDCIDFLIRYVSFSFLSPGTKFLEIETFTELVYLCSVIIYTKGIFMILSSSYSKR